MGARTYLCIDLKTFYASVECVERGLDPFTTNLVVADPDRTEKTICLAVSPAMKALGVRNRCRVFEIPKGIRYIMAKPRMRRYMEVSAKIYGIYLRYVAPEDIHVYSIDECFIDATPYLRLYGQDRRSFAQTLMDAVLRETGIFATAGIGENLFFGQGRPRPSRPKTTRAASGSSRAGISSIPCATTSPSPTSGASGRG